MRKLINDPTSFVDDFLEGILQAHPEHLRTAPGQSRALCRIDPEGSAPTVGIVTGGGSGHLPLFLGYVGQGLCSAVAVGNTFSAPSTESVLAATKAAEQGMGVLYLYGNYGGDRLNFDDAAEMAEADGIETVSVRGADDVASAPPAAAAQRRGVAGLTFGYKCAGAAAAAGYPLAEVADIATRALSRTRSMGVGLSPTIIPEAGRPTFELGEDEIELGIGIHGEPGTVGRGPTEQASDIADVLVARVLEELPLEGGSEVVVLVNSLGATPDEELYIVYAQVAKRLRERDLTVHRALVGRYATSLEMAGCSVSMMVLDSELTSLFDAACYAPLLSFF